MNEWVLAAGAAFWSGVLTSISPCLLATNTAAIAFLARRVDSLRAVGVSCACYIAGQAIAFILLAAALVTSLLSMTAVSHALQTYLFRMLGPVLIVCALFLFEWLNVQLGSGRLKAWANARANSGGAWAAMLLGVVFAMSFCPTTAALFFGSLVPLAVAHRSAVALPLLYAIGVALPVIAFALVIAVFANRLAAVFAHVGRAEQYARKAAGAIFLTVGIYFTLAYTLEMV